MSKRVLVIRLGALGDLALCFQAFQSIRMAHPEAETALLTMPDYAGFARKMPWFDQILVDPRAPCRRIGEWLDLVRRIREFKPWRVYDLQGKFRQTVLYGLLKGPFGPEWSGAAPLCSHPRPWPPVPGMHFTSFIAAQLERAGVAIAEKIDTGWLDTPLDGFSLPEKFVLLVPGCAPGREYKRWPASRYAELAERLKREGIASVAVGAGEDARPIRELCVREESVIDLCGRTSLFHLAALARRAEIVVGNDTGPVHIAAAAGARVLALMSDKVDPLWSAPKGERAKWLQGKPLAALTANEVMAEMFYPPSSQATPPEAK